MFFIALFFPDPGSNPRLPVAFSCHLSLDSFNLEVYLNISLSFFVQKIDIFWSPNRVFCKIFFSLGLSHLAIFKDFFFTHLLRPAWWQVMY